MGSYEAGVFDQQARERQKRKAADSVPETVPERKGDARDQAGQAVGVSGRTMDKAAIQGVRHRMRVRLAVTEAPANRDSGESAGNDRIRPGE